MTTTKTTMSLARDERHDLADLLATLTPDIPRRPRHRPNDHSRHTTANDE